MQDQGQHGLAEAIREKVREHDRRGGRDAEVEAWLLIRRWEGWLGRDWEGETPRRRDRSA